VIGVVLYVVYQQRKKGGGGGQGGGGPPSGAGGPVPESAPDEQAVWIAGLRAKDPGFDLKALVNKAADVFVRSQKAWSARQLEPVRPFMSDATYQRFLTQLELMRAQNVRNVTADQQVLDVTLVGVEQNPFFDTVHLAITARMLDTDVAWDASEEEVATAVGNAQSDSFVELWSFVRKPGAKTDPGKDLLRGKCPNCGAPFEGGAANTCQYCGAIVNSGNYDWTLAEITQESEAQDSAGLPEGFEDVRHADPAFSLEVLEDRASLIFGKWIEARTTGKAALMAKLAPPAFVENLSQELMTGRTVFRDCAVGAVITNDLSVSEGGTRALVELRWSANTDGEIRPRTSTFVLARGADAKTNAGNGMSTARCPNCNAPLTASLSSHCDFCGASLGSNPSDWLLTSVRTEEM
jgi:hypothetical protein